MQGIAVARKMNASASPRATLDHALIPPVKPDFIGGFY
jgi:hypothetical protein